MPVCGATIKVDGARKLVTGVDRALTTVRPDADTRR